MAEFWTLGLMRRAPTTNWLIAKRSLQKDIGSAAPDWATDQLVQGRDTPHLRQLAGATGSENAFELEELVDRSLHELGLSIPSRERAVLVYSQELARDYLDSRITSEYLLQELCQLCISTDYMKPLYQFYLLRWTHDDLKTQVFSFYLRDATRENFDMLLRAEVEKLVSITPNEA